MHTHIYIYIYIYTYIYIYMYTTKLYMVFFSWKGKNWKTWKSRRKWKNGTGCENSCLLGKMKPVIYFADRTNWD